MLIEKTIGIVVVWMGSYFVLYEYSPEVDVCWEHTRVLFVGVQMFGCNVAFFGKAFMLNYCSS